MTRRPRVRQRCDYARSTRGLDSQGGEGRLGVVIAEESSGSNADSGVDGSGRSRLVERNDVVDKCNSRGAEFGNSARGEQHLSSVSLPLHASLTCFFSTVEKLDYEVACPRLKPCAIGREGVLRPCGASRTPFLCPSDLVMLMRPRPGGLLALYFSATLFLDHSYFSSPPSPVSCHPSVLSRVSELLAVTALTNDLSDFLRLFTQPRVTASRYLITRPCRLPSHRVIVSPPPWPSTLSLASTLRRLARFPLCPPYSYALDMFPLHVPSNVRGLSCSLL